MENVLNKAHDPVLFHTFRFSFERKVRLNKQNKKTVSSLLSEPQARPAFKYEKELESSGKCFTAPTQLEFVGGLKWKMDEY